MKTHTHTHTYTRIHTYTHTHIHTYTHTRHIIVKCPELRAAVSIHKSNDLLLRKKGTEQPYLIYVSEHKVTDNMHTSWLLVTSTQLTIEEVHCTFVACTHIPFGMCTVHRSIHCTMQPHTSVTIIFFFFQSLI